MDTYTFGLFIPARMGFEDAQAAIKLMRETMQVKDSGHYEEGLGLVYTVKTDSATFWSFCEATGCMEWK